VHLGPRRLQRLQSRNQFLEEGAQFHACQVCPQTEVHSDAKGEVLVGLKVRTRDIGSGDVVDQLAVLCLGSENGMFSNAFAGLQQSQNAATELLCPAGMFISGISGRMGALLDQVQLHCSTL
jgi:hypothetical protein